MRHALSRRPVALLVATTLLSTGMAGVLAGPAHAAEAMSVTPTFARNSDSAATALVFNAPAANFQPGSTVQLTLVSDPTVVLAQQGASTVSPANLRQLTATFDLRQQPPGAYSAAVRGLTDTVTHSCSPCFTLTGFTPTVTSFARTAGDPNAAATFRVGGSNFARGSRVSFTQGGVVDPGLTWTTTPAAPGSANPTATTITGSLAVNRVGDNAAKGGAHDVVVTNTDGKVGTCLGCLTIPRIDSVYRADKTAASPAVLGYGVAAKNIIVKGSGFLASTVAKFHAPGAYGDAGSVTVNSTVVSDSGTTLTLNVTTANPASQPVAFRDLSLSNPTGGYETFATALTLNPRPRFNNANQPGSYSVDRNNPGVSSKGFVLNLIGSGFQVGSVVTFTPSTGITINSFTPALDGDSGVLNLDLAANTALSNRDIVVTNPDFGSTATDTTAAITPSAAPIVTSLSPSSVSAGTTSAALTFSGLFSKQVLTQNGASSPTTAYTSPRIVVLKADGTIDPDFGQSGPVSYNNADQTAVTATLTLPANAASGPRRIAFLDKNFSLVECFTADGGPCFTIDSIAVTSVTPNLATNDQSQTVTLAGSGFALGAVAKLERTGYADIVATTTTVHSATSASATFNLVDAPPSAGPAWSVRMTNPANSGTGILRNAFTISGPAPHYASVTPTSVPSGQAAVDIAVTGTGFAKGAKLTLPCTTPGCTNPTVVASQFVSSTRYVFTLDTRGATASVPRNVIVTNADGSATNECTGCFQITAAPTVSSASPNARAAGSPQVDVTITGTGFNGTPTASFSGSGITTGATKSVNTSNPAAQSFVVPVTVAAGSLPIGARDITVTNGDGTTASCSGCFTVKAAAVITSISPAQALRGSSGSVTVSGTGFDTSGVTLSLGPDVTVTNVVSSATSLTANYAVAAAGTGISRGPRDVVVTNTAANNGSRGTLTNGFAIGDLPGKPTAVAGTRGDKLVALTWTAPDNGGLPITSYTVTVTTTADPATPVAAPVTYPGDRSQTGATVTGLTNGTAYSFSVRATNALGTGAANDTKPSVTPATTPDVPTAVSAIAGPGQATVSFTAPANNGGNSIVGYTVTSSPEGKTASGAGSPITVTGLTGGVSYTFTVVARNAVGPSNPSEPSNAVTPAKPIPTVSLIAPVKVIFGTTFALTGKVTRADTSVAPGLVTLKVRDDAGTTQTIGNATPTAEGNYTFSQRPAVNGTYTVSYVGDARNAAATSAERRTLVAVRITVSAQSGPASTPLVVRGSVGPNKAGKVVGLYKLLPDGRRHLIGKATLTSTSTYQVSVMLPRGNYRLVVGLPATPGNAAGATRFNIGRT